LKPVPGDTGAPDTCSGGLSNFVVPDRAYCYLKVHVFSGVRPESVLVDMYIENRRGVKFFLMEGGKTANCLRTDRTAVFAVSPVIRKNTPAGSAYRSTRTLEGPGSGLYLFILCCFRQGMAVKKYMEGE
jgi:hypothetical protein